MSALRSVGERFTHRVVVRRRLPPPFERAHIYASSEGGLRYLKPRLTDVDPPLLRLTAEAVRAGAVVWDIGANVGLFSFAAASLVGGRGAVLAVEPDTWLVRLLRRSVETNTHLARVDVLPVAVGARLGVGRFHIARRNRSTSHLDGFGTTQTGGIRGTHLVPVVTLDWLAEHFPRPDVVKIDVEGAEALVLGGAHTVLRGRPTLLCEVAADNAEAVAALLRAHDYLLYDGDLPAEARHPVATAPASLLAVPRVS
jgi:FkbM family methyltransferase